MVDYNKLYTPGDVENSQITTVVEIPQGSSHKVEYNREKCTFELDRVEPSIFAKPTNYGFIPQTLDEDGDELDTLIVTAEPLPVGIVVEARIIGVLNFEDEKGKDHKVICVPSDDRNEGNRIQSVSDLGDQWKKKIEHHFTHYKDLKAIGTTKVSGFGDIEAAKTIIRECIVRYNDKKI
jgi:inorganic pyrophosphatase